MSRVVRMQRGASIGAVASAALIGAALIGGPMTADAGAQTLDDLDDAREAVSGIEDELDGVIASYEQVWADIEVLRVEIEELRSRADHLETEARTVERLIGDRARATFKRGATSTVQTLLNSEGPQQTVERAGLLAVLQGREQVRLAEAVAARTALDQTLGLIADEQRRLDALQAELDEVALDLQARLETAQQEADEIASLVSRQRRVARGEQQGIYSCIFGRGAFRFRDTWGAPRSGGRAHRGTDVFAAYGAPVYAITSGVVDRHSNSALGGLGLYLRGDEGNLYYYAHLDSIEPEGRVGRRVTAGELIARNGSSGNADRWAPHVHFELHPGGGGAVNPYPWLAAACH